MLRTHSNKFFVLIILLLILCFISAIAVQTNNQRAKLVEVASSDMLWTGVAVSHQGRIFVNYPRWSPQTTTSVAEINQEGEAVPYPDNEWNTWSQEADIKSHFQCVQSVYIDKDNFLWILDTGNPFFGGVVDNGVRLIKLDLSTDKITQTIHFDTEAAPQNSYLNDVRVDTKLGYAYLTDSAIGAILVVNLATGKAKRYLSSHKSTIAEDITITVEGNIFANKVHADGLGLTPDGKHLYYKALTGKKLYKIPTNVLREAESNEEVEKAVEFVKDTYATDAIAFDGKSNLYLTSIEENSIHIFNKKGKLKLLVKDNRLKWPDSFSVTPDDVVYVSTSQLHLGFSPQQPYKIFKIVYE